MSLLGCVLGWIVVTIFIAIFLNLSVAGVAKTNVNVIVETQSRKDYVIAKYQLQEQEEYAYPSADLARNPRFVRGLTTTTTIPRQVSARGITEFVQYTPASQQRTGKRGIRRALIMGLDYEGKDWELEGCINDAKNMQAELRTEWGFSEFMNMTDHTRNFPPTRRNMEAALRWLTDGTGPEDSLVWHYSGHGDRQGSHDTIVPLDWDTQGQILDEQLRETVVTAVAATGACLTVIFDCCHSGTGMQLKYNWQVDRNQNTIQPMTSEPVQALPANVVLYSASLDDQDADDTTDDNSGLSYGTMTHALLTVLNRFNRRISLADLLVQAQKLIHITSQQRPQLSSEQPLDLEFLFSFVCATGKRTL